MAWKYPALLFRDQILLLLRTTWSHIPSKFSILRWTPVLANWQDVWTAWCQIFQQFSEHLYQGHAVDFNDKVLQTLRKKNFVNCVCENEEDNPDMAENSRTNYGGGLMGKERHIRCWLTMDPWHFAARKRILWKCQLKCPFSARFWLSWTFLLLAGLLLVLTQQYWVLSGPHRMYCLHHTAVKNRQQLQVSEGIACIHCIWFFSYRNISVYFWPGRNSWLVSSFWFSQNSGSLAIVLYNMLHLSSSKQEQNEFRISVSKRMHSEFSITLVLFLLKQNHLLTRLQNYVQ